MLKSTVSSIKNRRLKVVVLDDSEICRATAKLMLEEQGFVVIVLSSTIQFSGAIKNEQPDIALIDVSMPTLQGNQVISVAHRVGIAPRCPMVLFSTRPPAELAALASQCGAAGYISKSDDWDAICKSIRGFIGHDS